MIFVRCHSHRARHRLLAALDRDPQAYWTAQRLNHRGIYRVDSNELCIARSIPGITRVRNPDQYAFTMCWSPRQVALMVAEETSPELGEREPPVKRSRRRVRVAIWGVMRQVAPHAPGGWG